jgi:putative DNA primase/helicase
MSGGLVFDASGRPVIPVTQDQGDLISDARQALVHVNNPPRIFRKGGVLARVGRDDDGRAVIIPLTTQAIRAELAEKIGWRKVSQGRDGEPKISPAGPPGIVVDDLFTRADQLAAIPVLDQIVTAPVFAPDGTLVTAPEYAAAARVWYEPVDGMQVPPVSQRPPWEETSYAAKFLMTEYLGDFPFTSEASRQHALGALLLPFARLMIDGPVPLQAADASTPGSGKGLLQRALMYPALGSMLPALPGVLDDEEELRKKITTALMRGQQIIRWDNVQTRVDSANLSSVLTEPIWQDRILGINRDVEIPVRAIFMMNGNNLSFSQEIARRAVPVRLDVARCGGSVKDAEEPWRRTGFRHPDLMAWARQNRGQLVWAALTLVQAWIAARRPAGSRSIGSFEKWAAVTGGIVEHAAGDRRNSAFLNGLDDLYADSVTEKDEKITFLETWHSWAGEALVTTQQILSSIGHAEPFGITGQGSPKSQQTRIGYALGKMRDQVWGGYQVVKQGRSWQVRKVQP